jgi:Cu/Zn superoxide dismutase
LKRITKAALGGLAGCALVLGGAQAASGEIPVIRKLFSAPLADLNPAITLDSAEAVLKVTQNPDGTYFLLRVKGINTAAANEDGFAAHLHVGPCEAGNGTAAGDHYNTDVVADGVPYTDLSVEKSSRTEVWFDLFPDENGVAVDQALVQFVPVDDGVMSIVIHQNPNNLVGVAGPREACLPVVTDWTF